MTSPRDRRDVGASRDELHLRIARLKRASVALALAGLGALAGLAATHRAGAAAQTVRTPSGRAVERPVAPPAVPAQGGFFAQDGTESPRFAPNPDASPAPAPPPPVVNSSGS